MSFYSDAQSQHLSVPPSAQPYQSLFGGSSQDILDHDAHLRFQEDETINELDGHPAASGGPSVEYDESDDDLAYIQTSERETSHSPTKDNSIIPSLPVTRANSTSTTRKSENSTSPPPYRPNRFHGPAHLWLDLTRDDREIVESLEEINARDLAAHLYNVHILQSQRVAKLGRVNTDQPDEGGPKDNELDNNDLPNNLEEWTAWPMPSDEVPRAGERRRRLEDDRWTFRMKLDPRPSAELEECIISLLSKTAKERFQAREWGSPIVPDRDSAAQSDTDAARSGTEGYLKSDKQSSDDGAFTPEWASEQEVPRFRRPVVQIDYDESQRKLRPFARNVITQFENLLVGLHRFHGASPSDDDRSNRSRSRGRKRARSSSLTSDISVYSRNTLTEHNSESEHHNDTKSIGRPASSSRRKLMRTPERSHSRGRKRTRRTSQSSQHSSNYVESAPTSRRRADSTSTNGKGQAGLTDWRDVAGVASMIGLAPVVLQRATRRFAALVGEDMRFPTIPEDSDRQFMESVLKWTSHTQNELVALELDESLPRLALGSRAASTGKRSASPAGRGVLTSAGKELPPRDNSAKREHGLVCPFKKCHRHNKGFSRRWNLNQHLKTMHPGYRPKDNKSQTRSAVHSGYDSDRSE